MGDLCPHDDEPTLCPPCQRAADQGHGPAVPTGPQRPTTFRARFPGNCVGCGRLILPDDEIASAPDGDGYLRADCCL